VSVNRYQPHVMILLEDRANAQIANGFVQEINQDRTRRIQILPEAGGWHEVLDKFENEHVPEMDRFGHRLMILVLDLDDHLNRLVDARDKIPAHLRGRVFIVGVRTEPEGLRQTLGAGYEEIGAALARDCRDGTSVTWGHDLLAHNADEVHRLSQAVRPLLFA
jgi:hypothetical protein